MCNKAKQKYYETKIIENENDSKKLFQICNNLLHKIKDNSLPSHSSPAELANKFVQYFKDKITKIREDLKNDIAPTTEFQSEEERTNSNLGNFKEISEAEVSKLILSGNSKSCCLDPLPTTILKQVLPSILPAITSIINKSLTESRMPTDLKQAVVTPLLKKSSLDKENLKNFRPVSNLPFIGKCIEKVAISQMEKHLSENSLIEPLQSAYKVNHSTETALIKVTNDILCALDKRQCVYLVLLDLSAAFDTIDHQVFNTQMKNQYGISGSVLKWMQSYLEERKQQVTISGTPSDEVNLEYGFPQGSCIGPFGFKLYTKPLTEIAERHGISIHLYADDTQLYTAFDPDDSKQAMDRLESCIEEIRQWMGTHYLKLNDAKTEFMIFGSQLDISRVTEWTVTVGDTEIFPSKTARNIGAYLDAQMNMRCHINNTIRACYCQLRAISQIRKFLSTEAAETLCHAFITSRIDNLNSLLYKIPKYQRQKIQRVQNSAARVTMKIRKTENITPVLKKLHWLPVKQRIEYKILLLVFKCRIQVAPSYLMDMIKPYQPARSLRSSDQDLLVESRSAKVYGERAFSVCGPKLWNKLPPQVKESRTLGIFKTQLKTHLFKEAYAGKDSL